MPERYNFRLMTSSNLVDCTTDNRNRIMTGVRFLFRVTLRRLDLAAEIYHLREPEKIPAAAAENTAKKQPRGAAHHPQLARALIMHKVLWL